MTEAELSHCKDVAAGERRDDDCSPVADAMEKMLRELARLRRDRDALVAACEAAVAYDAAIQRRASEGKSWVAGDDLDTLYASWIAAANAALAQAKE